MFSIRPVDRIRSVQNGSFTLMRRVTFPSSNCFRKPIDMLPNGRTIQVPQTDALLK